MSSLFQHFRFIIIPLLLVPCPGCSAKVKSRISGGLEVPHSMFPYAVYINATWVDNSSLGCGGSIVTNKVILTACQCMLKNVQGIFIHPIKTKVYAGITDLTKHDNVEELRWASRYVTHPDCKYSKNEAFWINDVGLIEVSIPFIFNKEIRPITFFSYDSKRAVAKLANLAEMGAQCRSPGWGLPNKKGPQILKRVDNGFIPLDECNKTLCGMDKSFCFDYFQYGNILLCVESLMGSACHGDTGGPFVCETEDGAEFVFGMVGTISQCVDAVPLIYSSISPILDMVNWNNNNEPHDSKDGMSGYTKRPQTTADKKN